MTRRRCHERGSVTIEFVVVVVAVLAGFVPLAVYGGRVVDAENQVRAAAHAAARAATLRDHPDDATTDALAVAQRNLTGTHSCTRSLDIAVDTSDFRPGGTATVTVTCHTDLADLATLGVGRSHRVTASAVEVIDLHRSAPR